MTHVLVSGGAGFIGSNFIRTVLTHHPDWEILNFDKLTYSGNLENLEDVSRNQRYRFIRGDVADARAVENAFSEFKPELLINFAAETHVDRSIHVSALEFIQTNNIGVFNLLEVAKVSKTLKRFVQVSTDEVYGSLPLESPESKFTEDSPFRPNVPYAATKAGGDLLCRAYFQTWGIPVVVTHCSNNFGPYQYPEKLIPYAVLCVMEAKPIPLYGDGKNVRDWISVFDHIHALELCLLAGKPGETYNIGADNERSNLEIARLILRAFRHDESFVEFVGDRPGHDRRYAIDATKIKRELGWKPSERFEEALEDTIRWYREHAHWVKRVREQTGVANPHIDLWKAYQKA